jgi:hypothetical protein
VANGEGKIWAGRDVDEESPNCQWYPKSVAEDIEKKFQLAKDRNGPDSVEITFGATESQVTHKLERSCATLLGKLEKLITC